MHSFQLAFRLIAGISVCHSLAWIIWNINATNIDIDKEKWDKEHSVCLKVLSCLLHKLYSSYICHFNLPCTSVNTPIKKITWLWFWRAQVADSCGAFTTCYTAIRVFSPYATICKMSCWIICIFEAFELYFKAEDKSWYRSWLHFYNSFYGKLFQVFPDWNLRIYLILSLCWFFTRYVVATTLHLTAFHLRVRLAWSAWNGPYIS